MTVADTVAPLVRAVVGAQVPVGIRCWDGSRSGPSDAPWQVHIVNRRCLRRLLWAPNDLGFARAYVSGDIDIEGDLLAGLDVLEQVSDPSRGPGVRIDKQTKKALATAALRLGIIGLPPKPPAEEMKPARGHRHDKDRDAAAISHHYDVGNDFYRLVLGESMTYSCAYWAEPSADLDAAQYAKCDLVARKLGLTAGDAGPRRRLRVGDLRAARGAQLRRARRRCHPVPRAGGVRRQTDGRRGCGGLGADPSPGLPRRHRRSLRRDLEHRHGRARRCRDAGDLRRGPVRAAAPAGGGCSTTRSRDDQANPLPSSPKRPSSIAMCSPTEKSNRSHR